MKILYTNCVLLLKALHTFDNIIFIIMNWSTNEHYVQT